MALSACEVSGAPILLKTVDSTLRGHVSAEIAAAFHASGRSGLVFAPAFPAAGRTTVDGMQLVHNVPVHLSDYGKDPVHPARTARLAELVPSHATNTVILNASTQDELDAQVAGIEAPSEQFWVGSPGLALALAKRLGQASEDTVIPAYAGPALVVIGSANPVSHRQAAALHSEEAVVLIAPPGRMDESAAVLADLADRANAQLRVREFGILIATGGDTMEAILDRTGTISFALLGETEPGFPIGSARIASRDVLVGMKAGGFGGDEALRRAVRRLSKQFKAMSK